MILSKTCDYAVRAALYISTQQERTYVPIREMSEKLEISFHFLTKILQTLTQNNIMISFKGPNGGLALARAADSIKIIEIIEAIDGSKLFQECLLGLNKCDDHNPCPLHNHWAEIREQIRVLFAETSLASLADKVNKGGFRLTN